MTPEESGQYNIGHICTGLQCERGLGAKTAMRWLPARGPAQNFTFLDLHLASNRFASALGTLGLAPGDVFFTFLPKLPEQFVAVLGALKARVTCGTLFSNFGEAALLDRLGDSGAKAVLTRRALLPRLARIRARLPQLRHIITVDGGGDGALDLAELVRSADENFVTAATPADAPSLLHYTSGSTGKPKGVLHCHGAAESQRRTAAEVLGLTGEDIYWCTADQGWITGTSYGIIGPWSLGVTQVHYGGGYSAALWAQILESEKVTVWYSAPTALRMLMTEDPALFAKVPASRLRGVFSVGEPLNPEVIAWGRRVLSREIYDTWFQTETGAIMISNRPGLEVRPGSMGRPVGGTEAVVTGPDGKELPPGAHGELCLKPGWPSMFVAYLNNQEAYAGKFCGGLYHTGDTARKDADGYFWFEGRSDDVINTAGHLISPFEVESALLEVQEVAEAGVIGAPDPMLFEKVVAFVRLRDGFSPSPELELKLRLHVSNKASTIATPRDIVFCEAVPKNKSGKIMRRVLRARYSGKDAGDLSTLEET